MLLYVERWLTAPLQQQDGSLTARDKGTPQGGVVSPILANLFLHYALRCVDQARNATGALLSVCR